MNESSQNIFSFHLAGIVPVAGQKLDFDFPWHDCLQPIAKNYLAVERAILECAYAGCETIWLVCHDDTQPLVRYRLGDYVQDPVYFHRTRVTLTGERKEIPIYYIPIHPKDKDKRDCLAWSILYGAQSAFWLSKTISKWVVPDKYYVAFPYGIYSPELLQSHRKQISSKNPFFITYDDKTVKDNEYLGFTFNSQDFLEARRLLRKEATGEFHGYNTERIPLEKRWSARFFTLDKVFKSVTIDNMSVLKVPWYHNIGCWNSYCNFLGSSIHKSVERPEDALLGYHEWNPIGVDNEE